MRLSISMAISLIFLSGTGCLAQNKLDNSSLEEIVMYENTISKVDPSTLSVVLPPPIHKVSFVMTEVQGQRNLAIQELSFGDNSVVSIPAAVYTCFAPVNIYSIGVISESIGDRKMLPLPVNFGVEFLVGKKEISKELQIVKYEISSRSGLYRILVWPSEDELVEVDIENFKCENILSHS